MFKLDIDNRIKSPHAFVTEDFSQPLRSVGLRMNRCHWRVGSVVTREWSDHLNLFDQPHLPLVGNPHKEPSGDGDEHAACNQQPLDSKIAGFFDHAVNYRKLCRSNNTYFHERTATSTKSDQRLITAEHWATSQKGAVPVHFFCCTLYSYPFGDHPIRLAFRIRFAHFDDRIPHGVTR